MKPQTARGILVVLCCLYIPVYLLVLFVAMATGGDELIAQPGAWYAAVAPLAYVGLVGAYVFGLAKRPMPRAVNVAVHSMAAPALMFSFLGMGLLLPVFAVLFRVSTKPDRVAAVA